MTKKIELEIPEEILLAAQIDTQRMGDEMRKLAAFELFSQLRLSGGKAAQLAGISIIDTKTTWRIGDGTKVNQIPKLY